MIRYLRTYLAIDLLRPRIRLVFKITFVRALVYVFCTRITENGVVVVKSEEMLRFWVSQDIGMERVEC